MQVKKEHLKKLVVIIGPTAAKKSAVANALALALNGQIINGDAFQVYKEINAGVNKPTPDELKQIKHHLINHLSYKDEWNIAKFQKAFHKAYTQIVNEGTMPILCGGSHLYTDAILKGYDLSNHDVSKYIDEFSQWKNEDLYHFIEKYDPESALKIGLNNYKRLVRCASIIKANNYQPKSQLDLLKNQSEYDPLIIMVNQDRDVLYQKINERFDLMYHDLNWKQEVIDLVNQDPNIMHTQAFKAIGYLEIAKAYLENEPLDLDKLKQKTRQLAKRQLTWCNNKFLDKLVFDPSKDNINNLIEKVKSYYYDKK